MYLLSLNLVAFSNFASHFPVVDFQAIIAFFWNWQSLVKCSLLSFVLLFAQNARGPHFRRIVSVQRSISISAVCDLVVSVILFPQNAEAYRWSVNRRRAGKMLSPGNSHNKWLHTLLVPKGHQFMTRKN